MTPQGLTLFHNPNCSTSRKALGLLRDAGATVQVVEYLKPGWTRAVLDDLLQRMGAGPRDILRRREPLVKTLGLEEPGVSDEAILKAMIEHPVLVERPILCGPKGAAVCRPVEIVQTLI